jgi:solute carrier family 25 (mitochondrial folate transporter), member 32
MPIIDLVDRGVINAFSGALSGVLTAAFVCPLDVLKTRMQVQDLARPKYIGIAGGLATLVREEGLRAAYRGLQPTVLALLPTWALYFFVYETIKNKVKGSAAGAKLSPTLQYIMASVGAGACNVVVTNPLWVIKTRLQTQAMPVEYRMLSHSNPTNYKGTLDAFRTMLRKEGVRGLYAGMVPSIIGIAHVAIQFPLYESLKHEATVIKQCQPDDLQPTDLVVLSSVAKMIASTATYPHEVLRSQMHVSKAGATGVRDVCQRILQTEGIRGFYRGCLINLIRTTPAAAITFTSYEIISRNLFQIASDFKAQQQANHRHEGAEKHS